MPLFKYPLIMRSTRHVVRGKNDYIGGVCADIEDKGVDKPDGHLNRDSLEERLFEEHVRGHFLASRVY